MCLERKKHIDVRHHVMIDEVTSRTVAMEKISTHENSVVIMTKAIPVRKFRQLNA